MLTLIIRCRNCLLVTICVTNIAAVYHNVTIKLFELIVCAINMRHDVYPANPLPSKQKIYIYKRDYSRDIHGRDIAAVNS